MMKNLCLSALAAVTLAACGTGQSTMTRSAGADLPSFAQIEVVTAGESVKMLSLSNGRVFHHLCRLSETEIARRMFDKEPLTLAACEGDASKSAEVDPLNSLDYNSEYLPELQKKLSIDPALSTSTEAAATLDASIAAQSAALAHLTVLRETPGTDQSSIARQVDFVNAKIAELNKKVAQLLTQRKAEERLAPLLRALHIDSYLKLNVSQADAELMMSPFVVRHEAKRLADAQKKAEADRIEAERNKKLAEMRNLRSCYKSCDENIARCRDGVNSRSYYGIFARNDYQSDMKSCDSDWYRCTSACRNP